MILKTFRPIFLARLCLLSAVAIGLASVASAQTKPSNDAAKPTTSASASTATAPPAATADAKSEEILRRAVEALGGAAYLGVKSVVGRGYFSNIKGGVAVPPMSFTDYLIYPDRERTDFRSSGVHDIQTNVGADKGWAFDGMTRTISDLKPEQIESFRVTLRTSFDNLVRGEWRKDGATLTYAGRREAGLARRNETVRVTYPDGFMAEFEFAAREGLPAKVSYKRKIKVMKDGVEEEAEVVEEDRIERYINLNGVQVPFTIDHYRDGDKTSRINYDTVEFNQTIPDSIFARPANPKAIK
jgi:hypothetical protein